MKNYDHVPPIPSHTTLVTNNDIVCQHTIVFHSAYIRSQLACNTLRSYLPIQNKTNNRNTFRCSDTLQRKDRMDRFKRLLLEGSVLQQLLPHPNVKDGPNAARPTDAVKDEEEGRQHLQQ